MFALIRDMPAQDPAHRPIRLAPVRSDQRAKRAREVHHDLVFLPGCDDPGAASSLPVTAEGMAMILAKLDRARFHAHEFKATPDEKPGLDVRHAETVPLDSSS